MRPVSLARSLIVVLSALGSYAASSLSAEPPAAPETVQVALYGISVQMAPATTNLAGVEYRAEISSVELAPPNGELMPLLSHEPYTHGGLVRLTNSATPEPMTFEFGLNVPPFTDKNQNGLHDFFEVAETVSNESSQGAYLDPATGENGLQALWSRAADSKDGTCQLTFVSTGWKFTHSFSLSEYHGTIEYTNTPTATVGGWLKTASAPDGSRTVSGAVWLERISTTALNVRDGTLANTAGQPLPFRLEQPLDRVGTNYLGFLVFTDGDLTTPEPDYVDYVMVISDDRDANGNGVPDLGEPLRPQPPRLRVVNEADAVILTIEGSAGFVYTIEATGALDGEWFEQTTVLMLEPVETVRLPQPWSRSFWRATAE